MTLQPTARLRPFRPIQFGRYTLLAQLGAGGMGEIFLARMAGAQGFEKFLVIKKILPHLSAEPDFVDRFVSEARVLARLTHGSIAQVLDVGLHEGDTYIALEHVDGKDLRKVAARMRERQLPPPLTFVLYVMGRVLDALAYAHRKRDDEDKELHLVHRDISPQNVLVSYEGEVKIIDFGLAKSTLSVSTTNPSIVLGKFLYMSPEQARHQPVDRRSDLYSVGLCMYELIAGKNPFDDSPPGELMGQVADPKIAPLQEVDPLCPGPVSTMVMKAIAKDPAHRFQTAEEFRARVLAALHEIDFNAGPETVSKFMRETFATEYQAERRLLASVKEMRLPQAAPAAHIPSGSSKPLGEKGGVPTPRELAADPKRRSVASHRPLSARIPEGEAETEAAVPLALENPETPPTAVAGPWGLLPELSNPEPLLDDDLPSGRGLSRSMPTPQGASLEKNTAASTGGAMNPLRPGAGTAASGAPGKSGLRPLVPTAPTPSSPGPGGLRPMMSPSGQLPPEQTGPRPMMSPSGQLPPGQSGPRSMVSASGPPPGQSGPRPMVSASGPPPGQSGPRPMEATSSPLPPGQSGPRSLVSASGPSPGQSGPRSMALAASPVSTGQGSPRSMVAATNSPPPGQSGPRSMLSPGNHSPSEHTQTPWVTTSPSDPSTGLGNPRSMAPPLSSAEASSSATSTATSGQPSAQGGARLMPRGNVSTDAFADTNPRLLLGTLLDESKTDGEDTLPPEAASDEPSVDEETLEPEVEASQGPEEPDLLPDILDEAVAQEAKPAALKGEVATPGPVRPLRPAAPPVQPRARSRMPLWVGLTLVALGSAAAVLFLAPRPSVPLPVPPPRVLVAPTPESTSSKPGMERPGVAPPVSAQHEPPSSSAPGALTEPDRPQPLKPQGEVPTPGVAKGSTVELPSPQEGVYGPPVPPKATMEAEKPEVASAGKEGAELAPLNVPDEGAEPAPLTPPPSSRKQGKKKRNSALSREWSKLKALYDEVLPRCGQRSMVQLCDRYKLMRSEYGKFEGDTNQQQELLSRIRELENDFEAKRNR